MAACPKCGQDEAACSCIEHGSLLDFLDTFRSAAAPPTPSQSPDRTPTPAPIPDAALAPPAPVASTDEPQPDWLTAAPAPAPAPSVGAWAPPAYLPPPPNLPPPPGPDPYGSGWYGQPSASGFGAPPSKRGRWGMTALACLAAAMVVAGVAVFALGSHHATAQTTVAGALSRSFGQRTADVRFTMSGADASGQSLDASGTGTIDFANRSLDLHMTISSLPAQIEAIFLGSTVYESIPGIATIDPGKSWVSIDLSAALAAGSGTSGGSPTFSTNPTEALQLLTQKGAQVTPMGASTVDGVTVQGYTVSYPPNVWDALRVNQNLPSDVRAALANITMTSQVYITRSNQVARVEVAISSPTGPGIDETLDFSDYGVATSIAPPDGTTVVSFQQFLSDAQSATFSGHSSPPTGPATSAAGCVQPIPPGASSQAAAYLTAVNQDDAQWAKVTSLVMNDPTTNYNSQILALQTAVDTQFEHQLQSIDFTGPAATPAGLLKSIVRAYITAMNRAAADLRTHTDDPAVNNTLHTLDGQRAQASSELRASLNLPQSDCILMRP
jgi:hypothetical protein